MPVISAPPRTRARVFHGWWIVAVTVVGLCLSVGPVFNYTFGIFATPLGRDLGVGRGALSLAVALLNIMVAIGSPIAGRLVDRFGGRRVIVSSIVALSACLWALAAFTHSLMQLYVLYALAGLVGAGGTPVSHSRVVANWFDRRRGLALGFTSAGIGLGTFLLPSLVQFLIAQGGWRLAYGVLGGVCVVVAAPVVALFLRNTPEEMGLLPDGGGVSASTTVARPHSGLAVADALRTRTFWQLALLFFGVSACVNGTVAHLAPMLMDRGMSGTAAAFAASLFGAATIAGRVGNGYLVDRFFAPYVAAVLFGSAAIGLWMLASGARGGTGLVAAALLGLAIGAESDVMPFLVSRYFGMRAMGTLFGGVFAAYTLGAAAGPYAIGLGFDATGSYATPLTVAFVVLIGAVLTTFALPRYQRQEAALL